MKEREQQIWDALEVGGTIAEISARTGMPRTPVRTILKRFVRDGLVKELPPVSRTYKRPLIMSDK